MTISSTTPVSTATVANAQASASERAADAALAKANAKLSADRQAKVSDDVLRDDQKAVAAATKAAQKADAADGTGSGAVNITV